MRFTHVIFDMDGTLLDTINDLATAANQVCAAHGWPTHTVDEYKLMVGNAVPKLVERYMPAGLAAADPELYAQTMAEQRAAYDACKRNTTGPYPGILAMLDALHTAGVRLGVLSNKDHSAVMPLAEEYFPGRFDTAQGLAAGFAPKPDPAVTRALLARMGADAARTLYVGDSDVDVFTGHNAGMAVCGVAWGFRGRTELAAAGADYIAETPADITRLVLGANGADENSGGQTGGANNASGPDGAAADPR